MAYKIIKLHINHIKKMLIWIYNCHLKLELQFKYLNYKGKNECVHYSKLLINLLLFTET